MADSLTGVVARLYRAGSESSEEARKLRLAADEMILWIKINAQNIELPRYCEITPHGGFRFEHAIMEIGQEHARSTLLKFSQLISDGFLDELCTIIERDAATFRHATEQLAEFQQAQI